MKRILTGAMLLLAASRLQADGATIALNASDALNTSSFNSGLHWTGGAAPAAGNAYQTAGFLLRTPQNATSVSFPGDSLEVQSGGTLRQKTAATVTITNLILQNTAILELTQPNGVNTAASAGTLAGGITVNGTATLHAGISGDNAGHTFTLNSTIGGSGGFTTSGSVGTLILTATNTYAGLTTVTAGTLGGFGVISGPITVTSGGSLAPGGTTNRTLTISNSLTLNGTVSLKINKTGAMLTSDLIRGISTLTYGGILTVTATGDTLALGDTFTLFSADNYSGTFPVSTLPTLPAGLAWSLSQLNTGKIFVTNGATVSQLYLDPTLPLEMRVTNLIAQMTLSEKAAQLYHRGSVNARLGIPNYGGWNQCLHGVWHDKPTTLFPVSIAAAATWDPDLIRAEASAIADEARAYNATEGKGLIYRAPVINISRNPFWGRIQECYGEDPWLTGRMGVSYLQGLQGNDPKYLKLAGTLKHFAVNNVEANRLTLSATVPERWLHEFWLPHWKAAAIEGRAQSIMASYNRINGIHSAVNTNLLTEILRTGWGYKGFVVSDLSGIDHIINTDHIFPDAPTADAAALSAGCDYDDAEYRDGIPLAVVNGLVSEAVVDHALGLVFKTAFKLGVFDPPSLVSYSTINASVIRSAANQNLALQVAQASMVLLKNQNGFLPLNKSTVTNVAVIGPLADTFVKGNYYGGAPVNPVTPRQGLLNRAATNALITYAIGCGISTDGTPAQISEATSAAANAQVVILCLGTDGSVEAESNDRETLELTTAQQSLLQTVSEVNSNVVLVLINAGPLAIPWAKTNTPAIIEAWYNGEKGGNAIADVVFGDVNPSGKLPYTVYSSSTVPGLPPQDQYDVSQGFTYMFFTNQALFPFGHGLSYTTFSYSNLVYSVQTNTPDSILTLSVDVQNTGPRAGDEVVQAYVHLPGPNPQAIKKLVGFKKVHLEAGATQTTSLSVSVDQLSYFDDVTAHDFVAASGNYSLMVGSSSADIRASRTFNLLLPALLPPGAPGGLGGILYNTNVTLEWNFASRAVSYIVKRSLASGGPWTVLASGLTNVVFTDTSANLNATNYYLVTALNAAGESLPSAPFSVLVVPYVAPPGSPSGLAAFLAGTQVALKWNTTSNAIAYIVKRSVKSTGPFVVIAGGWNNTNFVDYLPNSSLTYFYQVTATNAGGESLPATTSVKLSQAPAAPWWETDVGNVGVPGGSASDATSGVFTLQGAGATIYGAADGFHFVYLPLTNDATLVARVVDTMPTSDLADGWDKSGVMIRETLAVDSKYGMVMMTSGQGCAFQYRTATGGNTTRSQMAGLGCPYWVKLERVGTSLTAYHSPDGYIWTQLGAPATTVMDENVYAGLAVSARNTTLLNTATFDAFSISVPGLSAPTGLNAALFSGTQVQLSWIDNSSLETVFAVERSLDGINGWMLLSTSLPPNSTNYLDGSTGPSTAYSFRVRCLNQGYASEYSAITSVVTGVSNNPTNLSFAISGGNLTLSWPTDYQGWILQSQTNPLPMGLTTHWFDVAGSSSSTQAMINIEPANPTMFFRLRHP
jgi:beta-glucosidase